MAAKPSFAIIGAGIGGLALAGFLSRAGIRVTIYEQAGAFQRIGAGIQMSPNAMRVLRALGLERWLAPYRVPDAGVGASGVGQRRVSGRAAAFRDAETRYGAPYLLMHRGDLHAALFSAVPPELHCVRQEARRASSATAPASSSPSPTAPGRRLTR